MEEVEKLKSELEH